MGVRFEVGDIVTGKQSATGRYTVTIRGAILKVLTVEEGVIGVRMLGCDREMASDSIRLANKGRYLSRLIEMIEEDARNENRFSVQPDYFEFYAVVTTEDASELNDFLDCM